MMIVFIIQLTSPYLNILHKLLTNPHIRIVYKCRQIVYIVRRLVKIFKRHSIGVTKTNQVLKYKSIVLP